MFNQNELDYEAALNDVAIRYAAQVFQGTGDTAGTLAFAAEVRAYLDTVDIEAAKARRAFKKEYFEFLKEDNRKDDEAAGNVGAPDPTEPMDVA